MSDIYVKSGVATARINSTAYALGAKVVISRADTTANYLVVRKWVLEATINGTTGAAVPAWPATVTQDTTTVVDGGVTWTFRKPGFSSGTTPNWTFATIYLDYGVTALAAGQTAGVSSSFLDSLAGSYILTSPGTAALPCRVLSVSDTATPPTAITAGATITTTGGFAPSVNGHVILSGLTLNNGTGTIGTDTKLNQTTSRQLYENCNFNLVHTQADTIVIGSESGAHPSTVDWRNCRVSFATTAQAISVAGATLNWVGGGVVGAVFPNNLFDLDGLQVSNFATISNTDFSTLGATANLIASAPGSTGKFVFTNVRLPANWTGDLVSGIPPHGFDAEMYNCDSGATNYKFRIKRFSGEMRHETVVTMTAGTTDGTTPYSAKMVSNANTHELFPLLTQTWRMWNDSVGVSKTLTIQIIHDSLTALTDAEVWVRARFLGTTLYPLGSEIQDARATLLTTATAQPASTVTWTTTGLTNPNKQSLHVTFTPQMQGEVEFEICLGKASYTIYVNIPVALT